MRPASGHIALKVTGFTNHLARFEARLPRHARTLERLHIAGSMCAVTATGSMVSANAVTEFDGGDFEDSSPLTPLNFPRLNDFYGPPLNSTGHAERSRFNPKRGRTSVRLDGVFPVTATFPDTATGANNAAGFGVVLETRPYRFSCWVRTDATLDGKGVSLHLAGPGTPNSLAAPACRAVGTLGLGWKELAFTYAPTAPGPHGLAVFADGSGAVGQLEALWIDDVQAVPAEGAASIQGQGDALARVVFSSNRLREFGQFILNRRHADAYYGTVSPTDTYKLHAVPEYPVVEGYVERFDLSLDTVWMLVEFTEDAPE